LHGLGDNRGGSLGIARHFTARGFDVLAYDGRAQGESGGDACTYGFFEKRDLSRVLDKLGETRALVLGVSLGGGVALQAAAVDTRIALAVAVSPVSDLRTAARERAPFFASQGNVDEAFRIAEAEAHFRADDVSAVAAAAHVTAPTLLIHGAKDTETPPAHSDRIYRALAGPKQLFMVPDTGHKHVLTPDAWQQIDAFIDAHWAAQ
jgi:pimeloyl-ACP methyl ester carboxylesterase